MAQIVGKDVSALRRATCRKCASIVEYELREVQSQTGTDYSGCTDTSYYLTCPGCNNRIWGVKHY